ncbi:penicillin-binding protein 1C [Sulfurirhabdus autotrophica]|uniref:penicillin-binding protein 1C n=1 Tax=Sulfurirhabdus autotrophica TaxID=1706046 RepID=UPI001CB9B577|nr:penicillin-binding protein 1C [Sulfurirhabdus autotrophica]
MAKIKRRRRRWLAVGIVMVLILLALDLLFPLPQPGRDSPYAVVVLARDGSPLRAFPDGQHVWRHPVKIADVSPLYLEALVAYEDKWFWWHPGVNPLALMRAGWQWMVHGRVISGGSTITMQVARMLDPTPRTITGKLRQIARALQLEWHYSKQGILTLYLNYAPMGGVLEGVEAASRGYLYKPAKRLTHAEAALLAVLPQAPSLMRPDRYPARARTARDKVLRRLEAKWGLTIVADALTEPVYAQRIQEPLLAPLLAERLRKEAKGQLRIDSTIDPAAQAMLEGLLADRAGSLPPRVSLATLVMDNRSLEVVAYAGSADFADDQRFAHVDMVQASRSPGSTLKPFLYGFALDEGLIHSESLLSDVPQSFSGYQPGNFQQSFHGAVSVSEALVKSLNVPAVEVLERLDPVRFSGLLQSSGLTLNYPRGASPNLSIILGGVGTTLEDLVGAYSSFARKGLAGKPRFIPQQPIQERRVMSEGAAFIVRDILETGGPTAKAVNSAAGAQRGIAWKTGTSFGFRDAWAIGVSDHYTVGVWVGRPDGTPNPGFFGANVASPLLVDVFSILPENRTGKIRQPPSEVTQALICWPLGTRLIDETAPLCASQRTAWVLGGVAPPTFSDRLRSGSARYTYYLNKENGKRVSPECARGPIVKIEAARWPAALEPWLEPGLRAKTLPPEWDETCDKLYRPEAGIKILGLTDGEKIRRPNTGTMPPVKLEVRGQPGKVYWMVNGQMIASGKGTMAQPIRFNQAGRYDITALDDQGRYDRISVSVIESQ